MTITSEISPPVATSRISATALADNLMSVGTAVLHAQGRALVTERQANLQVLRDPTGVGAAAAEAQTAMRDAASHYLDVVQPGTIALFAATQGAANLMNSVLGLAGQTASGDELSQMLATVAEQFDKLTQTAADTAKAVSVSADVTAAAAGKLSGALTGAIGRLEGKGGEIAQARAGIETTEKAIFQAIDDIVKKSNVVGAGIKGLVTYVLGAFGGDDAGGAAKNDKTKPAAKKVAADDKADDKAAGETAKDSGKIEPFPAESIDTITTGVEGIAGAQAQIKAKNALLVVQYQDLAALGALLAAAQTISGQTNAMAGTAKRLHDAASPTPAIIGAIADGMRALATQAATPAGRKDAITAISASADSWTRLANQLRQTMATMAGIGKLFPPLTLAGA